MSVVVFTLALAAFAPDDDAQKLIDAERATERDLDGDGVVDTFEYESGSGSQMAGETLTLHLSKSGDDIEVVADSGFGTMVDVIPIPAALLRADRKTALERVEKILFGVVSNTIDPGLRWLLDHPDAMREKKTGALVFVDGEKPAFKTSVIRAEGRAWSAFLGRQRFEQKTSAAWVVYKGFHHTAFNMRAAAGSPNNPEKNAEVHLATDILTGRDLWATCHGIYVVDTKHKRWAWAWITGANNFKMRFCSVGDAPDKTDERVRVQFLMPMREAPEPLVLDATFTRTAKFVTLPAPTPE